MRCAASVARRSLMFWMRLGAEAAAMTPMTAMTVSISARVKPRWRCARLRRITTRARNTLVLGIAAAGGFARVVAHHRGRLILAAQGQHEIDVHVRAIRQKLGSHRDLIMTVRGVGYRFREPGE